MRIGEVAQQAGIPTSTLRYYERIGLIASPQRKGRQRDYDESILEILRIIQIGKRVGFNLTQIRELLDTYDHQQALSEIWRELAHTKIIEIESIIAQYQTIHSLLVQSIDCQCQQLDECQLLA